MSKCQMLPAGREGSAAMQSCRQLGRGSQSMSQNFAAAAAAALLQLPLPSMLPTAAVASAQPRAASGSRAQLTGRLPSSWCSAEGSRARPRAPPGITGQGKLQEKPRGPAQQCVASMWGAWSAPPSCLPACKAAQCHLPGCMARGAAAAG